MNQYASNPANTLFKGILKPNLFHILQLKVKFMKSHIFLVFIMLCILQSNAQSFSLDTVQYVGHPEVTYDMVILAEGYTETQMPLFRQDAKRVKEVMLINDTYKKLMPKFNIFSISTPSKDTGISYIAQFPLPTDPIQKSEIRNTQFFIHFKNSYRAYSLEDSTLWKAKAIASEYIPFSDVVLILVDDNVNTSGRASYDGVAVASRWRDGINRKTSEYVINHELAHALAGVGDEYSSFKEVVFNKDITKDPTKIRWRELLGTPGVGIDSLFPGVYLPNKSCLMGQDAALQFCPVCSNRVTEVVEKVTQNMPVPHRVNFEKLDEANRTISYSWDAVPGATLYEVTMTRGWISDFGLINKITDKTSITFDLSAADIAALPGWVVSIQIRAFNATRSSFFRSYRTRQFTNVRLVAPTITASTKTSETSHRILYSTPDDAVKLTLIRLYNEGGFFTEIYSTNKSVEFKNLIKGKKYFVQLASVRPDEADVYFASPFSEKIALEEPKFYVAKASGTQEEFPVLSNGSAMIKARLIGDTLYVSGSFKNLSGDYTNSHLHRGLAGITGGVQIATSPVLDPTKRSGMYSESVNKYFLTADQKTMLLNRELYFNVHSTIAPGGEIRGQLVPESEVYYHSNLVSSNEIPPINTQAHGSLFLELKGDSLIITGSAKDITSGYTNSHLHTGYAGQSGGVAIALKPTFLDSAKTAVSYLAADNTFKLGPSQLTSLKAHQLYGNIHSIAYPAGEIRGQVAPVANARFRAYFSGTNEPVAVTSQAYGGLFINVIDSIATVSGSFAGLESDLAEATRGGIHIHQGIAGKNGGIQYDIKNVLNTDKRGGLFSADSNTIKLTNSNLSDLFSRSLYGNIHSLNNPGGEIRGQIIPEVQNVFFGYFNGMQENRSILTTGRGNVVAELNGNRLTLSGSGERLSDKINRSGFSHIHRGAVGQNGPISTTLAVTHASDSLSIIYSATTNSYSISNGLADSLRKRLTYVNIHTSRAPGGEIRAQLLGEATSYFHSILSGEGETPPINTTGGGGIMGELQMNRNVIYSGSFSSLNSKWNGGSHIHAALPGTIGPVRHNLTVSAGADSLSGFILPESNTFAYTASGIDSLRKRALYANIHTIKSPGGEIRGTLHNIATAVFSAKLSGINQVPPVVNSAGQGTIKAELNNTTITLIGSFAGLTGNFARDIAGGAQLFDGVNGANGDITFFLKTNTNADNKSGQFLADSNTFTGVTSDKISILERGRIFAIIRSSNFPNGEIRGQLLQDPNNFPPAVTITSPVVGDTVKLNLKGKDSIVTLSWASATDADGNALVYKSQTSLFPNFSSILNTNLLGSLNSLPLSMKSLDSALNLLGIPPGGALTLHARIVASDGSLNTEGVPYGLILQRAIITGVEDEFVTSYSMFLYPVPAHSIALLDINAKKSGTLDMRVVDVAGRLENYQKLVITEGINRLQLDVSKYTTGTHFIQLIQQGKIVAYFKLLKQ